jgi:XTP/dITP diphosphohydrolase
MHERMCLVLATNNEGKRMELQALLGERFHVTTMAEMNLASPDETGMTFAENAVLKAVEAARTTGLVALGDDSGLEVLALHGEPGVRSARYAGVPANDANNRALLLQRMAGLPRSRRAARFVCALAVASPSGEVDIVEGTCDGIITGSERGTNGFGYDALFELPDGRTFAELSSSEKSRVSHRGHAVRQALPVIERMTRVARPAEPGT